MVSYKTPGVYREEVFLKPEVALPTGIPGFIGFADAIAPLDALPAGLALNTLPIPLNDQIRYDAGQKRLVFQGFMTEEQRGVVLSLLPESTDVALAGGFRRAIATLFEYAQRTVVLYRKQEFTGSNQRQEFASKLLSPAASYLPEVVSGFFENGGTQCYVVRADPGLEREAALTDEALFRALAILVDLDLVAVPDAMTLRYPNQVPDREAIIRVQRAVLQHCNQEGDRIALLDALPSLVEGQPSLTLADILAQQQQLIANQPEPLNAAFYYPWLRNSQDYPDPSVLSQRVQGRLVPPCGHIAGIIARSDRDRGVFKAPANEELRDVLDLEVLIGNDQQAELNPVGINCLRVFPGRGIRLWGARTLSRDRLWRYISTRRLVLTLGRWIDRNMTWATFEPNSPRLWIRIQRELSAYLTQLWRLGALQGAIAEQAFYVKCDGETNPPDNRDTGTVITEIGLVPSSTAEFVIVRIIHRDGATEIR